MKKTAKKPKRISVTLSERDYKKLTLYAKRSNCTRPIAAKRLLHDRLAAVAAEKAPEVSKNQLGLFDSVQIDIFGNK